MRAGARRIRIPTRMGRRVAPSTGTRALAVWPRRLGLQIPAYESRRGAEIRDGVLSPEVRGDVYARVMARWTRPVSQGGSGVQVQIPRDDWPISEAIDRMFRAVGDDTARFFVVAMRDLVRRKRTIDTGLFLSDFDANVYVSTFGLAIVLRNRAPYRWWVHPRGEPRSSTILGQYMPPIEREARARMLRDARRVVESDEYKAALRRAIFGP